MRLTYVYTEFHRNRAINVESTEGEFKSPAWNTGCTRYRSWLSYCATTRTDAGSITNGIF